MLLSAFPKPSHGWDHLAKGTQAIPTPLVGHERAWERLADHIGHRTSKGLVQVAAVIGGERRYHHRPLTSWLLSNRGLTLTLVTDEMEAKVWNAVKGKRNPALPRIYDVVQLKLRGATPLWAVVHERLTWPVPKDWYLFVDTLFKWRAMQADALQPASVKDLEDFLRFLIDPATTDPKTLQRNRVEQVLPPRMAKDRRQDFETRRKQLMREPDLEGKIQWAKSALRFLHTNKIRFRDFDPSNLAKTLKGGRTVITNLAESRSRPKKTGRMGNLRGATMVTAAMGLLNAYVRRPDAVLAALLAGQPGLLRADADPMAAARRAIDILQRSARYLDRDTQALHDEFETTPPNAAMAQALLTLAVTLEKHVKRASQKIVNLR